MMLAFRYTVKKARSMFAAVSATGYSFLRDRRGNVLMIMAFAMIPLTFSTGMVIDYSRAARLQTKMNAVADAAALSATTKPMLGKPMASACDIARKTFKYWAANQTGLTLDPDQATGLNVVITEKYASGPDASMTCPTTAAAPNSSDPLPVNRVVTVTYGGQSANAFFGVLGSSSIGIGGVSTARSGNDLFYQIVFIVDISNSMAVGGTADDITKLGNDKLITCAFACHDTNGTNTYSTSSFCAANSTNDNCHLSGPLYCPNGQKCTNSNTKTYSDKRALARLFGYKLKIDFVNDAVGSFMTQLQPLMTKYPNKFSVGINTLGTKSATLLAPTTDYKTISSGISKIDLEVATPGAMPDNHGWTYISNGLDYSLTNLANAGDGSSYSQRKTYFIFLSDGVQDIPGNIIYNRKSDLEYSNKCDTIKADPRKIQMFSIETEYPVVSDDQYPKLVTNLPKSDIPLAMKRCASADDRYFLASDGPGISNAVQQVFSAIFAETSRLSQ